jgi:hypothetical protein
MCVVWHAACFPSEHRSNETVNLASAAPNQNQAHLFLLLGLALLLEHLLDNLLLLNEEGPDNAVPDTVAAPRAAVRTLDGLLGLGELGVLVGAESRDLEKRAGSARRVPSFASMYPMSPPCFECRRDLSRDDASVVGRVERC